MDRAVSHTTRAQVNGSDSLHPSGLTTGQRDRLEEPRIGSGGQTGDDSSRASEPQRGPAGQNKSEAKGSVVMRALRNEGSGCVEPIVVGRRQNSGPSAANEVPRHPGVGGPTRREGCSWEDGRPPRVSGDRVREGRSSRPARHKPHSCSPSQGRDKGAPRNSPRTPEEKSEGPIVARKPGNAGGAKGPYFGDVERGERGHPILRKE